MSYSPIRENVVVVIIRITVNLLYYYYHGSRKRGLGSNSFREVVAHV